MHELQDWDRLAHIEDERVALFPDDLRLKDERDGLANRHKEPLDVRVRHGERFVFSQLLLKHGNDAATRSQDIAESD